MTGKDRLNWCTKEGWALAASFGEVGGPGVNCHSQQRNWHGSKADGLSDLQRRDLKPTCGRTWNVSLAASWRKRTSRTSFWSTSLQSSSGCKMCFRRLRLTRLSCFLQVQARCIGCFGLPVLHECVAIRGFARRVGNIAWVYSLDRFWIDLWPIG